MSEPAEVLREALTRTVAKLDGHRRLRVVDLTENGIVVWDLHRDTAGTPRGHSRPVVPWHELFAESVPPEDAVIRAVQTAHRATMVLTCASPEDRRAFDALKWLRGAYPEALAVTGEVRVGELLREVVARDPLVHLYELVALKRNDSGRLELAARHLFPIGARRGDTTEIAVRCGPSDGSGTVFAVVTYLGDRRFQPVSVQSVKLAPGPYTLTAELRRPGLVRFHGLPATPTRDDRPWAELIASVPPRLAPAATVHLICTVEISGPAVQVTERLSRIRQLLTSAAADPSNRPLVSLISYGTHSIRRRDPQVPVTVLTWEGTVEQALTHLRRIETGGSVGPAVPLAARLECTLTEVGRRLAPRPGVRTALLTVGDRPAFPRRSDLSGVPPCPERRDWQVEVRRLEQQCPGMTFAAICDRPAESVEPIWRRLGSGAPAVLEAVDIRRLGTDLGLISSAGQHLPFPLIETP